MKIIIIALFLIVSTLAASQTINQLDANAEHDGIWKKYFDNTKILRYEGEFCHGKEIGLFKFYKNVADKASLTATKQFNEKDNKAYVIFYTSLGKVVSEGEMNGKMYIGSWKYYQKTSNKLLTLENYNTEGNLYGDRFVYYENGQIAEIKHYNNGKLEGTSIEYSENNVVLKEFVYVNDQLHGPSKYYNSKGELIIEGLYKNDKKTGIWKYYEDGKLTDEKDFTYYPKLKKK